VVRCPVGLAAVPGKLPMEVATSIAGEIIALYQEDMPLRQTQRGLGWRELQPLVQQLQGETALQPEDDVVVTTEQSETLL
jgi:xanthine dehydrogenase accessory factor